MPKNAVFVCSFKLYDNSVFYCTTFICVFLPFPSSQAQMWKTDMGPVSKNQDSDGKQSVRCISLVYITVLVF